MSEDRIALEERSQLLRDELKSWEKLFASANAGRKAGRDDIKADQIIGMPEPNAAPKLAHADGSACEALKYKEYNKIRDVLSGKVPPPATPRATRKRKAEPDLAQTPSKKRTPPSVTPRKDVTSESWFQAALQAEASPAAKISAIGPTPQKDGKLLGIFEFLPAQTPSRSNRAALGSIDLNVLQTPSRAVKHLEADTVEHARYMKTPQSSGKRFMLDQFVTPQKPKDDPKKASTPLSHTFKTPAFLRRQTFPLDTVDPGQSPEHVKPWKRRGFTRSLSSMIEEMRKEQEHEHDDEMDILRDMEGDVEGGTSDPPAQTRVPEVMVEDSQLDVTLDAEGFVPFDMEDDLEPSLLNEKGEPRKVWKKKGLKRQTRRVNMRPVRKQAQETQPDLAEAGVCDGAPDDGSNSEYDGAADAAKQPRSKAANALANQTKPKRKIKANALAHTNFVRLKIKSKNPKSNGRGRFGGRR